MALGWRAVTRLLFTVFKVPLQKKSAYIKVGWFHPSKVATKVTVRGILTATAMVAFVFAQQRVVPSRKDERLMV